MCTRRRYEGPLSVDPQIARLLRVHLRLPRALVDDIVRAQCYVDVLRYANGLGECRVPYMNNKLHGTVRWWRADGSLSRETPYVNGKAHGTARSWRADGSRWYKISYANGKQHGTETHWRADGTVERVIEWRDAKIISQA